MFKRNSREQRQKNGTKYSLPSPDHLAVVHAYGTEESSDDERAIRPAQMQGHAAAKLQKLDHVLAAMDHEVTAPLRLTFRRGSTSEGSLMTTSAGTSTGRSSPVPKVTDPLMKIASPSVVDITWTPETFGTEIYASDSPTIAIESREHLRLSTKGSTTPPSEVRAPSDHSACPSSHELEHEDLRATGVVSDDDADVSNIDSESAVGTTDAEGNASRRSSRPKRLSRPRWKSEHTERSARHVRTASDSSSAPSLAEPTKAVVKEEIESIPGPAAPLPALSPVAGQDSEKASEKFDVDVEAGPEARQPLTGYKAWLQSNYYMYEEEPQIVMPSPPNDKEKLSYLITHRLVLCVVGIFAFVSASAGLWLFTLSSVAFYWFGVFVGLIQIYLSLFHLTGVFSKNFDFDDHLECLNDERYAVTQPAEKDPRITLQELRDEDKRQKKTAKRSAKLQKRRRKHSILPTHVEVEQTSLSSGEKKVSEKASSTAGDSTAQTSAVSRTPLNLDESTMPTVDIYLPVCKEPIEVLANAFAYTAKVQYPAGKLNVYVLDDGAMDDVKALAAKMGFHYIRRDDLGRMKKAGNLRWAFARTTGDFFAIFDADFCPRADYLWETIPRMRRNPKIGLIQTPQYFRQLPNQTWVERGAGSVQELFYRYIQTNRNIWGAAICVGTCALYRREALVELGGTAEVGASEDVHTGFYLATHGWTLEYCPINLSCGISPDTPRAYFSQQIRWCQGSMSLLFSKVFWASSLNWKQKLCYISGMLYYGNAALAIFTNPLPGVLLIWFRIEYLLYYNLVFAIPALIYGWWLYRFWSRAKHSRCVQLIAPIQQFAYLSAIKDAILGTSFAWVPSGDNKAHKSNRYRNMRWFCVAWTFTYMGFFIAGCTVRILGGHAWWNFVPVILLEAFVLWRTIPYMISA